MTAHQLEFEYIPTEGGSHSSRCTKYKHCTKLQW